MNRIEIKKKYNISEQALTIFDTWRAVQGNAPGQVGTYLDEDLRMLCTVANLNNMGFDTLETSEYLRFNATKQFNRQIKLLKNKRNQKLVVIHELEDQINAIDYLCFQLDDAQ